MTKLESFIKRRKPMKLLVTPISRLRSIEKLSSSIRS